LFQVESKDVGVVPIKIESLSGLIGLHRDAQFLSTYIIGPKLVRMIQRLAIARLIPNRVKERDLTGHLLGMNLLLDEPSETRDGIDIHPKLVASQGFQDVVEIRLFHKRQMNHLNVREIRHQFQPA
jgi:hypothetical protein